MEAARWDFHGPGVLWAQTGALGVCKARDIASRLSFTTFVATRDGSAQARDHLVSTACSGSLPIVPFQRVELGLGELSVLCETESSWHLIWIHRNIAVELKLTGRRFDVTPIAREIDELIAAAPVLQDLAPVCPRIEHVEISRDGAFVDLEARVFQPSEHEVTLFHEMSADVIVERRSARGVRLRPKTPGPFTVTIIAVDMVTLLSSSHIVELAAAPESK